MGPFCIYTVAIILSFPFLPTFSSYTTTIAFFGSKKAEVAKAANPGQFIVEKLAELFPFTKSVLGK